MILPEEIKYLSLDYINKTVIPNIKEYSSGSNNPFYNYAQETEGMDKLDGCLLRCQWDYITEMIPKATQLFISINKGHFFHKRQ